MNTIDCAAVAMVCDAPLTGTPPTLTCPVMAVGRGFPGFAVMRCVSKGEASARIFEIRKIAVELPCGTSNTPGQRIELYPATMPFCEVPPVTVNVASVAPFATAFVKLVFNVSVMSAFVVELNPEQVRM